MIDKVTIKSVSESEDRFSISTKESTSFFMEKSLIGNVVPKKGDKVILNLVRGSSIRGMMLNGIRLYYKTDEQLDEEHRQWQENYEKEKIATFKKNKEEMDKNYIKLPRLLKYRLKMYRQFNPKFRIDEERYEVFVMQIGLKISQKFKSKVEINKFSDLPWEKQEKEIPELHDSGMSGNQFGFACLFAKCILKDTVELGIKIYAPTKADLIKSHVMLMPNALAPLSGHLCFPRQKYIKRLKPIKF